MVECCNRMISCDNIINNHAKLSKVYNIDKFVYNLIFKKHMNSLARILQYMVDNMIYKFTHKYNIALENISYALANGITLITQIH